MGQPFKGHRPADNSYFLERPAWMRRGACYVNRIPIEVFFPTSVEGLAYPKSICEECPVKPECLEFALASVGSGRDFGVWGGTSERERRRIRAERARMRAKAAAS